MNNYSNLYNFSNDYAKLKNYLINGDIIGVYYTEEEQNLCCIKRIVIK